MNNIYKENNENIIQNLTKGTLFKFSSTAHYSTKNTREYAIISSDPILMDDSSYITRELARISTAFNNIHKCSIIWNNEEHYALIFTEKAHTNRTWIKIRTGYINAHMHFSNTLPITQIITAP